MSILTVETAWRNYRGAVRDANAAAQREQGSRNAWATTLMQQMAERFEQARDELGLDVSKEKVLLQIGVPCLNCLKIITKRVDGHGLYIGGAGSDVPAYSECSGDPIDPTVDPMPVWPALPKAANA